MVRAQYKQIEPRDEILALYRYNGVGYIHFDGNTLLMMCCQFNVTDLALYLIENRYDRFSHVNNGKTAYSIGHNLGVRCKTIYSLFRSYS